MGIRIIELENAQGDLVDVLYFCSAGCGMDFLGRDTIPDAPDPAAAPCSIPQWSEDEGNLVFCAECGVRLNGPEIPIVVNLIGREYDSDGRAIPSRDPWMIKQEAREFGATGGRAAASWYFDGNTSDETYRLILTGLEEGDPAVLDTFPSAPLSGEWSGDPTPATVLRALDVDEEDDAVDDYLGAYEDAFDETVRDEIERTCLTHLPYDEVKPA